MDQTDLPVTFVAKTESGRGRGKKIDVPTINLALVDVHPALEDGIYACFVMIGGERMQGAMHLGPRPAFKDTKTCEVHLLDRTIEQAPDQLKVDVIHYLRPVLDFPSSEALVAQITKDVTEARAILNAHA